MLVFSHDDFPYVCLFSKHQLIQFYINSPAGGFIVKLIERALSDAWKDVGLSLSTTREVRGPRDGGRKVCK